MKAMILAAGRGERMRPLTDRVPKALLEAGGRPLVAHLIERLARCGYTELVVNVSHFAGLIERALGDGSRYGARIVYSREAEPLETGGGIAYALPLLGDAPFLVVNSDIYCDFDFARLAAAAAALAPGTGLAHLVLVDNPPYHPDGDMGLAGGRITRAGPRLTYGNLAIYHPSLFAEVAPGTALKLFPWAYRYVEEGRVSGEHYRGAWDNVGTPDQLAALDRRISPRPGKIQP